MEFKIQELYRKIETKDKKIFAVTFIVTFLAHAYRLMTYIPNHDSFWYFHEKQDTVAHGRWLLAYANGISSYFDTQYLCGLLSVIYISLAAVVITKTLDIKNPFLCYLAGIVIGVYPSVVCKFTYMFMADAFLLALLMSSLAAWAIISDSWKKRLGGSILLAVSVAIYQAYLSFAIVLLLIWLLKKLLIEKTEKIGFSVMNMMYSGALGGAVYAIGLRIRLGGNKLSDYQGINEATLLHPISWYFAKIWECYLAFYQLIIKDDTYANDIISRLVSLFWIAVLVIVCVKCIPLIKEKKFISILLIWVFLAMVPLAVYCMKFLGDKTWYHRLMVQSAALLWIFAIVLLDNMERSRWNGIAREALVFVLLLNIGNYIVGANISYLGFYNGYEKTYALFTRVVDRIEQLPDYGSADYLYVGGAIEGGYQNAAFEKPLQNMIGVLYGVIPYTNPLYVFMINQHIGGNYKTVYEQENIEKITSTKEYQEMPIWPAAGSVRMIDNVIAVKLGEG